MVLSNEIKGKIISKGLTQKDIAKSLGISEKTLSKKINNKGVFNANEIKQMMQILDITNPNDIFFAS